MSVLYILRPIKDHPFIVPLRTGIGRRIYSLYSLYRRFYTRPFDVDMDGDATSKRLRPANFHTGPVEE